MRAGPPTSRGRLWARLNRRCYAGDRSSRQPWHFVVAGKDPHRSHAEISHRHEGNLWPKGSMSVERQRQSHRPWRFMLPYGSVWTEADFKLGRWIFHLHSQTLLNFSPHVSPIPVSFFFFFSLEFHGRLQAAAQLLKDSTSRRTRALMPQGIANLNAAVRVRIENSRGGSECVAKLSKCI